MSSIASNSFFVIALLLASSACVTKSEREVKLAAPQIDRALPDKVLMGEPFQVQPDGKSAISVVGKNLHRGSRVRINGQPLATAWGAEGTAVSAIVPPELFAEPGMFPLSVESPSGDLSNTIPFIVLPRTGPAPIVTELFPSKSVAGKAFNEQPDGTSALGIVGKNFLPKSTIEINGEAQTTNFGDTDRLAALVPAKFLAKPGVLRITVVNLDGKRSDAAVLTLTPAP